MPSYHASLQTVLTCQELSCFVLFKIAIKNLIIRYKKIYIKLDILYEFFQQPYHKIKISCFFMMILTVIMIVYDNRLIFFIKCCYYCKVNSDQVTTLIDLLFTMAVSLKMSTPFHVSHYFLHYLHSHNSTTTQIIMIAHVSVSLTVTNLLCCSSSILSKITSIIYQPYRNNE